MTIPDVSRAAPGTSGQRLNAGPRAPAYCVFSYDAPDIETEGKELVLSARRGRTTGPRVLHTTRRSRTRFLSERTDLTRDFHTHYITLEQGREEITRVR